MAKYKIEIKRSARKELEKITFKKDRLRVVRQIQQLADEPRPDGVKKLSSRNYYRIRSGNYRIVYSINNGLLIIEIIKIADRKDVYRTL